jgi:intracellular sulfur oxidation DsrE/DsrF family protein
MEPTSKNPVLLDEKDGIPAPFNNAGLKKQLDRGVTVLACNLALQDCIDLISKTDKVDDAEARKRAVAYLVPGVNLQPSGVFAVTRAQEAGASYVKAS